MKEKEQEKECATCAHAGESMMKDPCRHCLKNTGLRGEIYPDWEPWEDCE
ncbi:MAG: hypothetical protein K6C12_00840 [Oscillospiraceae bacterium]|nr:hypothetical protein [Oscillospiraceae bacterium]